jgi:hypothetical protein
LVAGAALCPGQDAFGTWKMNPYRSSSSGAPQFKVFVARFERHPRGEAFTLDSTAPGGHATTASTILYLDGKEREYQGDSCSGAQSSRRVDDRTIEIVYQCPGAWTRLVRRSSGQPNELVINITERRSDGSRIERHLILEKPPTKYPWLSWWVRPATERRLNKAHPQVSPARAAAPVTNRPRDSIPPHKKQGDWAQVGS